MQHYIKLNAFHFDLMNVFQKIRVRENSSLSTMKDLTVLNVTYYGSFSIKKSRTAVV